MNANFKYDDNQLLGFLLEEGALKEQALSAIWNKYSPKLFRYCLHTSLNKFEADEIHQVTWIKFYNYIRAGLKINSIEKFLFNTAYIVCREKFRSQKAEKRINEINSDMETFSDYDNFYQILENDNLMMHISIAANYLDDSYKDIFMLKWFSSLSYEEISEIVEETVEVVRKRSYRAMDKITQILQPIINEIS